MTSFILGICDVTLSGKDLMVETKVGDEIVFFVAFWFFEAGRKDVSEAIFGGRNVRLSIGNISLLRSKVWHEIVFWVSFRLFERCCHHMTKIGL